MGGEAKATTSVLVEVVCKGALVLGRFRGGELRSSSGAWLDSPGDTFAEFNSVEFKSEVGSAILKTRCLYGGSAMVCCTGRSDSSRDWSFGSNRKVGRRYRSSVLNACIEALRANRRTVSVSMCYGVSRTLRISYPKMKLHLPRKTSGGPTSKHHHNRK